ncbi:PilZ domain-containing protein [Novosphingobium sp.]|uniref:PilZ domain-containing protein n=1 Tax=Novosphingobium sp. TaxID=1874826 RepID=UPI0026343C12|nr:PilZ domain-containing protein [Novosphingobium sp.]
MPGRRGDARVRLHLPARLVLLSGTQQCILEDLSVTGAAIIPQGPLPAPGASAILMCEHIEGFGMIRWARHGRCGLMFDEKMPLPNVIALRHVADSYEVTERERNLERARAWVQGRSKIL